MPSLKRTLQVVLLGLLGGVLVAGQPDRVCGHTSTRNAKVAKRRQQLRRARLVQCLDDLRGEGVGRDWAGNWAKLRQGRPGPLMVKFGQGAGWEGGT